MNPPSNTTIELTPQDALLFVAFQKRYAFIELLESIGAFDIRSGSLTIHFDNVGRLSTVDKNIHYRLPQ